MAEPDPMFHNKPEPQQADNKGPRRSAAVSAKATRKGWKARKKMAARRELANG